MREGISEEFRAKMQDAFLMLSTRDGGQAEILSAVGARRFLPAHVSNFEVLAAVANELGLLGEDSDARQE